MKNLVGEASSPDSRCTFKILTKDVALVLIMKDKWGKQPEMPIPGKVFKKQEEMRLQEELQCAVRTPGLSKDSKEVIGARNAVINWKERKDRKITNFPVCLHLAILLFFSCRGRTTRGFTT